MSQASGSAGGSTAYGSSHATAFFGKGKKGSVLDGLTFLGFQTLKAPLLPALTILFAFVELLQFLSFPLDPAFFGGSPLEPVLSGLARVRDPMLGSWSIAAVAGAIAIDTPFLAVYYLQAVLVTRGGTGVPKLFAVVRLASDFGRILLMPTLYTLVSPLTTGQGSPALAAIAMVVCVAVLAMLFPLAVLAAPELKPSASATCAMFPRWPVCLLLAKCVLVAADLVAKQTLGSGTRWGLPVFGAATWACFTALTVVTVVFVPYAIKTTNHGTVVVFGVPSVLSLVSLVSLASAAASFRLALSIVALALVPVSGVMLFVVARLRFRPWAVALPIGEKTATPAEARFPAALCYDLATRSVYSRRGRDAAAPDPEQIAQAEEILEEGIRAFPKSWLLKIAMALFLLDAKRSPQQLRHFFNGLSMEERPPMDVAVRLMMILRSLDIASGSTLNDVDQVQLGLAMRHARSARKALVDFWGRLARKKQDIDARFATRTAATIDAKEKKAEALFLDLLSRNPRDVSLLRKYARFLGEIKDEQERSEYFYQLADNEEMRKPKAATATAAMKPPRPAKTVTLQVDEMQHLSALPGAVEIVDIDAEDEEDDDAHETGSQASSDARRRRSMSFESLSSSVSTVGQSRTKILEYKAKIAKEQKSTASLFQAAALTIFILMFALVLCNFMISNAQVGRVSTTVASEHGASLAAFGTSEFPRVARQIWELEPVAGANLTTLEARLNATAEEFWASLEASFNASSANPAWKDATLQIVEYTQGETIGGGTWTVRNTTLYDAAVLLRGAMARIVDHRIAERGMQLDELESTWRLLLDNFEAVSARLFIVANAIGGTNASIFEHATKLFLGITIGIPLFVLLGALTAPVGGVRRGQRKVNLAVNLFKELPKVVCVNVYERLSKRDNDEQAGALDAEEDSSLHPTLKSIIGMTSVFFALIIFAAVIVVLSLAFFRSASNIDTIVALSGKRLSLASKVQLLVSERFMNDTFWDRGGNTGDGILAGIAAIRGTESELHEQARMGGFDLADLWLSARPCPAELSAFGITCIGLDGLMFWFTDFAASLAANRTMDQDAKLVRILAVYGVLQEWEREIFLSVVDGIEGKASVTANGTGWTLAVAIIFLFVFGFIIFGLLSSAAASNVRLLRMLLVVPADVLDKIDAVRFIFDRRFKASEKQVHGVIQEQEKKTKMILDGVVDAVVLTDEHGLIELTNPAAERILGARAVDLLGHSLADFFIPDDSRRFASALAEVVASSKQSSSSSRGIPQFPLGDQFELALKATDTREGMVLLASASVAVTADDVSFALFMKDIRAIKEHERALDRERRRADALLLNILPKAIADELKSTPDGHVVAQKYESVTVAFADIVEFTPMASKMAPESLVVLLNAIFAPWDGLCAELGVEKIKTIGDCYMVACGLPEVRRDHAERVVDFCLAAMESLAELNGKRREQGMPPVVFRFGVHSGSVVAGVIGSRKFQYDCWGDAVNTASRLESTGVPGRIQVSDATHALLKGKFAFEERGPVKLKGKGEVTTWLVADSQHARSHAAAAAAILASSSPSPSPAAAAAGSRPGSAFARLDTESAHSSVRQLLSR